MNQKTFYLGFAIVLAVIVGGLFFISKSNAPTTLGSSVSAPQIYSMTNGTSTVNTTSTQVIAAGWQNEAIISAGAVSVSCYLDGKTAASSSVAVGGGITIASNTHETFGPLGRVSYVGPINCIAASATVVGISKN